MEKTTKRAALDRQELQNQLDTLTGRSQVDAARATEVGLTRGKFVFLACVVVRSFSLSRIYFNWLIAGSMFFFLSVFFPVRWLV